MHTVISAAGQRRAGPEGCFDILSTPWEKDLKVSYVDVKVRMHHSREAMVGPAIANCIGGPCRRV